MIVLQRAQVWNHNGSGHMKRISGNGTIDIDALPQGTIVLFR